MAMSDCDECWDTPCTCGHSYERPRMSLARLREVVAAATRVLADREATGDPEPVLHPQQRIPAEQWGASIEIPAELLDVPLPPGAAMVLAFQDPLFEYFPGWDDSVPKP